jgi:hypothetical protein
MTTMRVNLSARDCHPFVNYRFTSFKLDQVQSKVSDLAFLVQRMEKEVINQDKKSLKKMKQIFQKTLTTSVLFLSLASPAMAAEPSIIGISPDEIMDLFQEIVFLVIVLGVGLANITMVLAGIYRIVFKKETAKEATKWSIAIMKGFAQVLTAPIILSLIFMIIYWFFGSSSFFVNPFGE